MENDSYEHSVDPASASYYVNKTKTGGKKNPQLKSGTVSKPSMHPHCSLHRWCRNATGDQRRSRIPRLMSHVQQHVSWKTLNKKEITLSGLWGGNQERFQNMALPRVVKPFPASPKCSFIAPGSTLPLGPRVQLTVYVTGSHQRL